MNSKKWHGGRSIELKFAGMDFDNKQTTNSLSSIKIKIFIADFFLNFFKTPIDDVEKRSTTWNYEIKWWMDDKICNMYTERNVERMINNLGMSNVGVFKEYTSDGTSKQTCPEIWNVHGL